MTTGLADLRAEVEQKAQTYYEAVGRYIEAGGDPMEAMTLGLPDEVKTQMPMAQMLGLIG